MGYEGEAGMITLFLLGSVLTVIYLGWKLALVKGQMKKLAKQLREQRESYLTVEFVDKDLELLVTELNELIDSVKEIRTEAGRGEESLRASISMISHDMRTPLTSVIGYLQLAEKNCKEGESLDEIRIALERAKYCSRLVNDLFEVSVIDLETDEPVWENVNLCQVVCEEILAANPQFEERGIIPGFEQADEDVLVRADCRQLARVVQNLISNAVKYSAGKVDFSVNQGKRVVLVVTNDLSREVDTGRIFDRFYQEDISRSSGGSGLGLYICRRLVENMGGEIWAECKDGKLAVKVEFGSREIVLTEF